MSAAAGILPAVVMAAAALYGLFKGVDVFSAVVDGVKDGLRVVLKIFPPLVALLTAVYMLRASGVLDAFTSLISPALSLLGIPAETGRLCCSGR